MKIVQNMILNSDSYKASHFLQYPPDTSRLSSYVESRGGEYGHILFFGLQAFLIEYLSKPITQENIEEAEQILLAHGLPFNREGWKYILNQYGGYLPLTIEAIPEGTMLSVLNVMCQVVNNDPKCFWLTSYIETALVRAIWYPTSVATLSWHCKAIMYRYLLETADATASLPFKLHDFGSRGVSSFESAAIGGLAHLVNFHGTDTLVALTAARKYYNEPMAAFSIPAAEHSTITSWGKQYEADAYAHIFRLFSGKDKIVSIVSDSYDLWHALDDIWGDKLQHLVKDNLGVLVIRPDSGDPVKIVTQTIKHLMAKFGFKMNSKGYQVLPDNIRIIQGDGVNIKTIAACLQAMKENGQSAENIAFGMGGALLQKLHRDTLKFAMKANAIERNGQWEDVYKAPTTDMSKISKRGRLALIHETRFNYKTIRLNELAGRENVLIPVFKNGEILKLWKFSEVRSRAESFLLHSQDNS